MLTKIIDQAKTRIKGASDTRSLQEALTHSLDDFKKLAEEAEQPRRRTNQAPSRKAAARAPETKVR